MAEVQNIGAMDYAAANSGINTANDLKEQPDYNIVPAEEFTNMPVVYDEATEQKKKAALGMTGATILGISMLAIGGFIGHKMGAKAADEAIKAAEEAKAKAEEAIKNYEKIQEVAAKVDETIAENNEKGVFGRFLGFQKMKDQISELMKPFRKDASKAEDAVEGSVEKAADDAAKKAGEA